MFLRACRWLALGLLVAACPATRQAALADDLFDAADERIRSHRQADASVLVLDSAGQPVRGAEVTIEQTSHEFLFGCNVFLWGQAGNEEDEQLYRSRFAELFNYATLPFYWPSYERRQGQPDHARTEQIARWCRNQGIATKGHPLAWNYDDPPWLPDDFGRIRSLQMARIDDCVSRFSGLIDRWDVVNEATHFERDAFKRRAPKMTGMWAETGRIEFVRQCFEHARKAGPRATLLINDYRTDPPYETLLEKLKDDSGRPIFDVIGIQSHMHGGTWEDRKVWEVCERFARFGVPLHFTETTILSGKRGWELAQRGGPWPSTGEDEQRQAEEVERFYTMLFSHPAVEAITWWDFSDRGAWQRAPAGFLRKDMSPKPAYDRLLHLVKHKWWTQATLETDAKGLAAYRGFRGSYRVTVKTDGEAKTEKQTVLKKNDQNQLVVTVGAAKT